MLRKIKLYGKLAKFVGHRVLEADVHNAAEAVKFLVANWPALDQHMAKQYYKVDVGSSALALDEIAYPIGSEDISITPVIAGAGNTGRIILGAALIAAAVVFAPAATPGLSVLKAGTFSSTAAFVGKVGMFLVLSGVAGLLTPVPKTPKSEEDPQNSFSFSGIQQTSRAGTAVPVCYGEILTGSVVISAEIDVSEQAT
jgi:predicted phage tail protein